MTTTPTAASFERAMAYRINRVARLLRHHLVKTLQGHDLSPEQYFTLFRLCEQDGRSHRELADPGLDDRANITRIVDGLQKRGLVERRADPGDGRVSRIWLTAAGRTRFEALLPTIVAERHTVFAGLASPELRKLDALLDHIEHNLEAR